MARVSMSEEGSGSRYNTHMNCDMGYVIITAPDDMWTLYFVYYFVYS